MTQWGLDTLFNPAKRHMDEEKNRLQSTREEVGDSSGGKRIDLESGAVTISKAEAGAAETSEQSEPGASGTSGKSGKASKTTEPKDETPAQARARARRQRSKKS